MREEGPIRVAPTGYTLAANGKYYKYYSTAQIFSTAKSTCAAEGGWLAAPLNATDNSTLNTLAAGNAIWLGISDLLVEGTFKIDSTNHPLNGSNITYSNWAGGEPNNYGGNEDLVELYSGGAWNDIGDTTRPFIGEWY